MKIKETKNGFKAIVTEEDRTDNKQFVVGQNMGTVSKKTGKFVGATFFMPELMESFRQWEKDTDKMVLVPMETINDTNVTSCVIRVNNEVKKALLQAKDNLFNLGYSEMTIPIDKGIFNVIILSDDDNLFSESNQIVYNRIRSGFKHEEGVEIEVPMTDREFNTLRNDTSANWSEKVQFCITPYGFYIVDRFDTDLLESTMLDYLE